MTRTSSSILFLHPTPGLNWQRYHSEACERLMGLGHRVVFAYNGPEVPELCDRVPTFNFNRWCREHAAAIDAVDVRQLEARYPKSNLWLSIVSERRVSNYSLLDGSYAYMHYEQKELERLIVAMVLFYQYLIDEYEVELILPHHPDNCHSTLLFQLARSLKLPAFLLFPDYYWENNNYFMFDSPNFTSSTMERDYRRNMNEYEARVRPMEDNIQAYINSRLMTDPSKSRPKLFPRVSLWSSLRNVFDVLRAGNSKLYLRKPDIVEGYGQLYLPASFEAFVKKNWNAFRVARGRFLAKEPPEEPFVYFPLQRVPEAAMLVRATSYLNQQGLLQSLSASLPSGYKLVVKDHPRSMGIHSAAYYKKLLELPNVVILAPGYSNDTLLERTELVVTIAGTLGYQQLMRGKPVVMFGRKFYEIQEGVIRVDDMNDLPYILKDLLVNGVRPDAALMKKSLYAFMAALLAHRYKVDATAFTLHTSPEPLADLVDHFIQHELTEQLEQVRSRKPETKKLAS